MSSSHQRHGAVEPPSDQMQSASGSGYIGIFAAIIDRFLKKPSLATAAIVGAVSAVGGMSYLGFEVTTHYGDWLPKLAALKPPEVAPAIAPAAASGAAADKFKDVMWLTTNDPSADRKYQVKKFVLHGTTEFTGTYENIGNGHKGPVHGFERDGVIEIVFAVSDVNSPGVDTVFLRPVRLTSQPDALFYVGFETAPDCDCNGFQVSNAPITSVAAILSNKSSLPDYVIDAVFANKPEVKEDFRTPADVEETLTRRADILK